MLSISASDFAKSSSVALISLVPLRRALISAALPKPLRASTRVMPTPPITAVIFFLVVSAVNSSRTLEIFEKSVLKVISFNNSKASAKSPRLAEILWTRVNSPLFLS